VIVAPRGDVLKELSLPIAHATNNVAEYTGLVEGLRAARELGFERIEVRTDSELLHRQLDGTYRVKNPTLRRFHAQASGLIQRFEWCRVRHIPRDRNQAADKLASAAAGKAAERGEAVEQPKQGSLEL